MLVREWVRENPDRQRAEANRARAGLPPPQPGGGGSSGSRRNKHERGDEDDSD